MCPPAGGGEVLCQAKASAGVSRRLSTKVSSHTRPHPPSRTRPSQVEAFFDVHEQMGSVPGGVHLEMTGDNVTECIGGGSSVTADDLNRCVRARGRAGRWAAACTPAQGRSTASSGLPHACSSRAQREMAIPITPLPHPLSARSPPSRYHTHCDPRLNAEQSLEMAFYVASRLRQREPRAPAARPRCTPLHALPRAGAAALLAAAACGVPPCRLARHAAPHTRLPPACRAAPHPTLAPRLLTCHMCAPPPPTPSLHPARQGAAGA